MKPSPCNRRPCNRRMCEIVRDFLVGLAVFFAVFTLAMLDSRTSHSATAVVSKPAPPGLHGKQDNSIKPAAEMSRLALKRANREPGGLPVAGAPSITGRTWMIAVMALFFAAMTAITLGLWRHLRCSVATKRGRKV